MITAIKQHETSIKAKNICGELGTSDCAFHNWRSKYAGLEVDEANRLRERKSENGKLKRLLPDELLEVEAIKGVLSKTW